MKFEISQMVATKHPALWAYLFNLIKDRAGPHCNIKLVETKNRARVTEIKLENRMVYKEDIDKVLVFEAIPR